MAKPKEVMRDYWDKSDVWNISKWGYVPDYREIRKRIPHKTDAGKRHDTYGNRMRKFLQIHN